MTFTEKKLSPVADGGGSAQAANDAHSTSQLVVADMQRQGNFDIIYASDKNEPARVSYARPPADPTPVAAETSDLQMEADAYRADVLAGMLAFINDALADTPPANLVTVPTGLNAEGVTQGRVSPHAETGEEKYPQSYAATLTNGDTPTTVIEADDGTETHPQYQDPEGNLVSVAGAGADVSTCRAPAEDVVPLTLSLQIDFPVVVSKLPKLTHARTHACARTHDCLAPFFVRSRAPTRPSPTASCSTRSTRAAKCCRRPAATRCPSAASCLARSIASHSFAPLRRRPRRRPRPLRHRHRRPRRRLRRLRLRRHRPRRRPRRRPHRRPRLPRRRPRLRRRRPRRRRPRRRRPRRRRPRRPLGCAARFNLHTHTHTQHTHTHTLPRGGSPHVPGARRSSSTSTRPTPRKRTSSTPTSSSNRSSGRARCSSSTTWPSSCATLFGTPPSHTSRVHDPNADFAGPLPAPVLCC